MKTARNVAVLAAVLLFSAASVAEAGPGRGGGGGYRGGGHSGGSGARYSGGHRGGNWQGNRHYHGGYYRPYWGAGAVFIGASYYAWPYYPSYYAHPYYYPAPAYYPPAYDAGPVEYIEQPQGAVGDWFYCAGSRAYYPQVQECPGGWQRVAPRPPSQ